MTTPYIFISENLTESYLNELLAAEPVVSEWESWSASLRDPKYSRCEGALHLVDDGFCCLGVNCDRRGLTWETLDNPTMPDALGVTFEDISEDNEMPRTLWCTMFKRYNFITQGPFANANDKEKLTFSQIADFIDELVRRAKEREGQ